MKMYQLFSAYYNGKPAVHAKTLDYIYSHDADDLREIRPCIWLWKGDIDPVYFVDYIGVGIGCTLATFDKLEDAQKYRARIEQMTTGEFTSYLNNRA